MTNKKSDVSYLNLGFNPPASEAPYKVSKNLSVCLIPNLTPIISGLAKLNGLNFFLGDLWQKGMSQKNLFVQKVADRAGAEGQNSNILTKYLTFHLTRT